MIKPYPSVLHGKGILTLVMLHFAKNIDFSNAVSLWTTYKTWSQEHGYRRRQTCTSSSEQQESPLQIFSKRTGMSLGDSTSESDTTVSDRSNSCVRPVSSGINSLHPRQWKRLTKPTNVQECFQECCDKMKPMKSSDGREVCELLRGGHLVTADAVKDTIVAAAAMTTQETVTAAVGVAVTAPYGIPLNGWKVIFQIFLTLINVSCWLIPLRSSKFTENKLMLSLANAFSGGIFLSLAFGHLIPECVHGFVGYNEALPYMIVLGGYLLIFFIEKVAFDTHAFIDHGEERSSKNENKSSQNGDVAVANAEEEGGIASVHSRSAVILLAALGVHSILEMTALGLVHSFGDAALLSLSIALHQPAESIALLVAFLKSGMPKNQIIKYLSVFSCMGPIGVGLGMAVKEFATPIVDSIMLATVAGTFLYVGATEVIPEEWEDQEHKWKKFFALIMGISSIFAITQYTAGLEGAVGA